MVYNGINSYIGHVRGKRKLRRPSLRSVLTKFADDTFNSVAAGAISGAIFKSTRGPRQMAISSGIVATVAGAWAVR